MRVVERVTRTAAATERFAAAIAKQVKPPLVLLLDGALGAGKTTFVRGFVRALEGGRGVVVQSPTFALARTYATRPPVHHLDLYRLEGQPVMHAVEELGLLELLGDADAFALVEWPGDLTVAGRPVGRVLLRDDDGGRRVLVELPEEAERGPR